MTHWRPDGFSADELPWMVMTGRLSFVPVSDNASRTSRLLMVRLDRTVALVDPEPAAVVADRGERVERLALPLWTWSSGRLGDPCRRAAERSRCKGVRAGLRRRRTALEGCE